MTTTTKRCSMTNNGTVLCSAHDIREAQARNDAAIVALLPEHFREKETAARVEWRERDVKILCKRHGIRYENPA